MKTIKVKNLVIGEGIPKICIPITGENREEILEELENIKILKPDLAEWRIDCYNEEEEQEIPWEHREKTWNMLKTISDRLGEIPLLFTFRTAGEGGSKEIMFCDYVKLLTKAARTGYADMIDVEVFFREEEAERLIRSLKEAGIVVVASNHHFDRTPDVQEITRRMEKMEQYGADILKIAVMPHSTEDMWTLLNATVETANRVSKPVVTMSMGKTGVLSRILGEVSGSSITFAAGKNASAPGQIGAEKMKGLLAEIHELTAEEN